MCRLKKDLLTKCKDTPESVRFNQPPFGDYNVMELAYNSTKFSFDGVHPLCLEGRFLKARLNDTNTTMIIEEYVMDVKSFSYCPYLLKATSIPMPDDVSKGNRRERIIGNPLCIGCHKHFIILQYATTLCQYIKFMVVDTEKLEAHPCQMFSRQFLREHILKAPLECYLNTEAPFCMVRLHPSMLLSHRSYNIQRVLFSHSNDTKNHILMCDKVIGFDRFDHIVSVRNTCFLNILPLDAPEVLLITSNSYCTKLTFEMLDTATWGTTELSTQSTDITDECCLLQTRACKTRAGDLLCVTCLTVGKLDDFSVVWKLYTFTFEKSTYENISKHWHNVTKWFTPDGKPVDKGSGELMLTVSQSDKMLEIWQVHRQCQPILIKVIRLTRRQVPSLKSCCRSVILEHINYWDIHKLATLPNALKCYLRFE